MFWSTHVLFHFAIDIGCEQYKISLQKNVDSTKAQENEHFRNKFIGQLRIVTVITSDEYWWFIPLVLKQMVNQNKTAKVASFFPFFIFIDFVFIHNFVLFFSISFSSFPITSIQLQSCHAVSTLSFESIHDLIRDLCTCMSYNWYWSKNKDEWYKQRHNPMTCILSVSQRFKYYCSNNIALIFFHKLPNVIKCKMQLSVQFG